MTERIIEKYRSFDLASAFFKGAYIGRVTKGKETLFEVKGGGIDENLEKLRTYVDGKFAEQISTDAKTPEVEAYIQAFKTILKSLSDGHMAMLKAHYEAIERTVTATELAAAAHYRNYSAANLQYGIVGKALFDELPIHLPTRNNGTPIYTFSLAEAGERNGDEDHWRWKMRPQVAKALEYLGLTR